MALTKTNRNFKKYSYEFEIADDETSAEVTIDAKLGIKGEVIKLIVEVPDWTNTVTTVVSAINSDSLEMFASSSLAQNDDYNITLAHNECVIMGDTDEKYKVTLSGVPGGTGGTVTITVYVEV